MTAPTLAELLNATFTNGLCPVLACALVDVGAGRFGLVETGESCWHVAAYETATGLLWDIDGAHTPTEFRARWGRYTPLRCDPEMTALIAAGDWRGLADYMTAPDPRLGIVQGVVHGVWAVTRDLATELIGRAP